MLLLAAVTPKVDGSGIQGLEKLKQWLRRKINFFGG
jgi:hypothetical protein